MPIIFAEIDVSGTSYLGDTNVQTKVVYQTGYTGLWFKKIEGIWWGYSTQPTGKLVAKDFTPLVPSPDPDTAYTPTFGNQTILYHGTSNPVEIYYDTTESKFKCGRPSDRG